MSWLSNKIISEFNKNIYINELTILFLVCRYTFLLVFCMNDFKNNLKFIKIQHTNIIKSIRHLRHSYK